MLTPAVRPTKVQDRPPCRGPTVYGQPSMSSRVCPLASLCVLVLECLGPQSTQPNLMHKPSFSSQCTNQLCACVLPVQEHDVLPTLKALQALTEDKLEVIDPTTGELAISEPKKIRAIGLVDFPPRCVRCSEELMMWWEGSEEHFMWWKGHCQPSVHVHDPFLFREGAAVCFVSAGAQPGQELHLAKVTDYFFCCRLNYRQPTSNTWTE